MLKRLVSALGVGEGGVDPDILDRICKLVVFLILVSGFVRGFFVNKITDDTFSNVVLIVIGFYFGHVGATSTKNGKPEVVVTPALPSTSEGKP